MYIYIYEIKMAVVAKSNKDFKKFQKSLILLEQFLFLVFFSQLYHHRIAIWYSVSLKYTI